MLAGNCMGWIWPWTKFANEASHGAFHYFMILREEKITTWCVALHKQEIVEKASP